MIITIDGPAGSGKSSVAKALAEKLNIYYLNTGLLYRAVAYVWLQYDPKLENISELQVFNNNLVHKTSNSANVVSQGTDFVNLVLQGAKSGSLVPQAGHPRLDLGSLDFIKDIEYKYIQKLPQIFYQNKNITDQLLNNSISQAASILSSIDIIREKLLALQRNVAKIYNIVCEGRDCGSVIFPNADYKFYLTASLDVRAKRIYQDKSRKDSGLTLEKVKEELEVRDARDQERKIAPLKIPSGAILIDNSCLNAEETLMKFLFYIKK